MKAICSSRACGLLVGVSVITASLVVLWHQGYRANVTASLARGIYRIGAEPVERGSLVTFCLGGRYAGLAKSRDYLGSGSCPSGMRPLLKYVHGLPGDYVELDSKRGICINGKLLTNSTIKLTDSQGRFIASALVPGVIPYDMALVLSDRHAGSFDGRYFGLVPLDSLQTVTPQLR